MDLFTFLLCKKKGGGGGGGLTYTLSADTVNKQIVLTPSEGDAQAITVPYATDASTVNGKDVPELENGKIPATYLPSYVDDVLEYENLAHFPAEGEVGKIYIALDTSLIYRWGGSVYAEINQSLALGETEATAYRGDRGKIAYDHSQSAHAPSNAEANQNAFSNITVGDTTIEADSKTDTFTLEAGNNITLTPDASTDKVTITATDTTYSDATTSVSGLMSGSDKTKLNGIATGAEVNQNTFSNVKIGSTTVAADSKTDTLELEAGDNIELTPDSTNDKITISGIPVTKTIRDVSVASFSDGGNAPIPSLTASIEPQQDLHGYDSPWAGGAGKNKLPLVLSDIKNIQSPATSEGSWSGDSYVTNGVTFKINTDNAGNITSILATGTTTGDNATLVLYGTNVTSAKDIVFSQPFIVSDGANGSAKTFRGIIWGTEGAFIDAEEVSFNAMTVYGFGIRIVAGYTLPSSGVMFYPMIRLSSVSDATFAPYSNICPINGWTEEVITRTGKNLFDKTMTLEDGFIDGSGQVVIANQYKHTQLIKINPNTSYVGSGYLSSGSGYLTTVAYYDKNQNFISQATMTPSAPYSITTPQNANYLILSGNNPQVDTIQLEEGTTPTTYEPYAGTTTTIPFVDGQGQSVEVFGGSVDVVNGGEQPVDRATITDWATRSFGLFNEGSNAIEISTVGSVKVGETNIISDKFKTITTGWSNVAEFGIRSRATVGEIIFKFPKTVVSNVSDGKQWLIDNNVQVVYELATPTTFYTQPTSIKSLDGDNNLWASTGPLREVTYRTQAYGDFIAQKDLPDAISDIKTLKLDENQILIGDGSFNKIGLFMDDYYDENLDITFSTEVTPQEISLTSQPAESVNQTTIISGDRTEYQTSLLSGTEVINTVNAIGMEVNVKENGSITHGIKIVSGDIRLLGSDTWDGTNISLKNALEAIQNNLYIANYNKTASLSSGSNTIALDMTGYTYNGTDIVNVYVDGLYKVNNTDYTITVNDSTGVASINYTAAAAGTMAIQVIKPKIGFTALTDNNGNNVTDSNGNSIDI
jgi:hypothetical protein